MKTITYNELIKLFEPGKNHPVLINTLSKEEFQKSHLPGSINIPADKIAQKAPELFAQHDWIVVYCASQQCDASHKAGQTREKLGFTNVYRFEGGIEEWKNHSKYLCTEQPTGQLKRTAA